MNKEYGSDFHLLIDDTFRKSSSGSKFWNHITPFFSGRSALRAILQFGIERFKWNCLFIPDYYCHEVYRYVEDLPIQLIYYQVHPLQGTAKLQMEDVTTTAVLKVNYFGRESNLPVETTKCFLIEDITHNLSLLHNSTADYVFGSLRKELPVPVGGFVRNNDIQFSSVSDRAENVALQKFCGMTLKTDYLAGKIMDKQVFRDLLISAENNFEDRSTHGGMPAFVTQYAGSLDVELIKLYKKKNSKLIKSLVHPSDCYYVLEDEQSEEFALILIFPHRNIRDSFKTYLIANNIYPIILWPGQKSNNAKLVEENILMMHIDFRYSEADIEHISTIINKFSLSV